MSKLKEKLEQVSMSSPSPMGFRAAQKIYRPRMALIALFARGGPENPSDYVFGADAGVLEWPASRALKKGVKADAGIPWGVLLDKSGADGLKEMADAGADFVLFRPEDAPLSLAADEKIGKVLVAGVQPDNGIMLRSLSRLPIDAVLIDDRKVEQAKDLTWQNLVLFRYFADMVARPVLAAVPADIESAQLQALCGAGVDGIVVRVEAGLPEDRISEIREILEGLAPPSKGREKGVTAIVPAIREEPKPAEEDEEEEDDE